MRTFDIDLLKEKVTLTQESVIWCQSTNGQYVFHVVMYNAYMSKYILS